MHLSKSRLFESSPAVIAAYQLDWSIFVALVLGSGQTPQASIKFAPYIIHINADGGMQKLTLGISGNAVGPAYWLDACSKMMNTAVVLLMDKVTLQTLYTR